MNQIPLCLWPDSHIQSVPVPIGFDQFVRFILAALRKQLGTCLERLDFPHLHLATLWHMCPLTDENRHGTNYLLLPQSRKG